MEWFATQVDRDFETGRYGKGIRLYIKDIPNYIIVKGIQYENGKLTLRSNDLNFNLILENEPNNTLFENTIYSNWEKWHKKNGKNFEDWSDYEPWAYNSLQGLAKEFGLYCIDDKLDELSINNKPETKQFYKKDF